MRREMVKFGDSGAEYEDEIQYNEDGSILIATLKGRMVQVASIEQLIDENEAGHLTIAEFDFLKENLNLRFGRK